MTGPPPSSPTGVRLAELLAVLSLGADLGMGQPMEHAMRQCLIALRLGEQLGLDRDERASLYYVSLIAWVGCHIDAYEQAKWFGDDLALKGDFRLRDMTGMAPLAFMASHLGAGKPLLERARMGAKFLVRGHREVDDMLANHWYAADALAEHLGLDRDVRATLFQTFERWDGKGVPSGSKGEEILLAARIVNLADVLEVFHRVAGQDGAVAVARERSGTQFAPSVVGVVLTEASTLFTDLAGVTSWDAVIAAEPGLARLLTEDELDSALEAIADFIDVKSPFTLGHSRGVADLAACAADELQLGSDAVVHVRRAALVHDIGRLGVSNAVWDKAGELTAGEVERVRLHPYLTDRMLAASPDLATLGATAVQHHERLDGSGYPRGLRANVQTPCGRVLAAADAYRAKLEPRPHRPAYDPDEAAGWMRDEVRAGRLDGDAVDGVLRVAGHPSRRRKPQPSGLTSREVEVLQLLARGLTNKEIADVLVISPKTAGRHIEHIYAKIGVSNRARASLFAVTHGLMGEPTNMG
jgi:HD-GYP domain-containing protein (c-di-GMP phosphodiesterase class II)/DNA-binding CsgD family transcriptional regulator